MVGELRGNIHIYQMICFFHIFHLMDFSYYNETEYENAMLKCSRTYMFQLLMKKAMLLSRIFLYKLQISLLILTVIYHINNLDFLKGFSVD